MAKPARCDWPAHIAEDLRSVVACLSAFRFRLTSEDVLQADIAQAFGRMSIHYRREHRLSANDRVDFLCLMPMSTIAVEAKVQGGRMDIYKQCARYCEHATVDALVLATNVAMTLPPLIHGKPATAVLLGRAWL